MIRSIGVLISILIFALHLNAQEEKTSPKLILGGSFFGGVQNSTENLGLFFGANQELIITRKDTEIGFIPYLLFGSNKKGKFGLGLRTIYSVEKNTANNPNVTVGSNGRQFDLGLDLIYRRYLFEHNSLSLFSQIGVGGGITANLDSQADTSMETSRNFIQSELEFGAIYRIAKTWNLLISIPVLEFRFQQQNIDFGDEIDIISTSDTRSTNFGLNTEFTNLNIGIEKLF